ncbi:protein KTI12 homolog isoform X1 [Amphibalanus amphitrite]|uniref:protein KTI12 homolog isoform X1 n=2 Tax=Amphibalanus amphitrite TaxID=1232801 RepID=UPI001C914AD2|nr:protein KTI12 homolog isoform X1 [Amphibalanus amphitrite]XP_043239103.1 protein KTI12 homolog isoform X1 [Amphibalanus amphitrite]XP_043239104.1 protein KTI12 homolog isoform X1 [Amphibalanus amphitrite]
MPFVVISGFPASGKTTRTKELLEFMKKEWPKNVVVISEHDFVKDQDKDYTYSSSQVEKDVRGALKGEVIRKISKDDIVILDGLNYIKGFRYELFCISKNCRTPQVTVHCIINPEQAWKWNESRPESQRYSRAVFDGLVMRYEEPDSRNRWDSPLVTVQADDLTPAEAVLQALRAAPAPKPNMSTQNPMLAPTDFLFELDRRTQDVVKAIVSAQESAMEGDQLPVTGTSERYTVPSTGRLTLAQLSRARRQFVSYLKTHPADPASIPTLFVQYLNNTDR